MSALKCGQCGLVNFADASHCKRCRTPFLRTVSTESGADLQGIVLEDGYVLPAPPSIADPNAGVWRDKSTLVMSRDAVLPMRCVKCNVATSGRLKRKMSWHHPALFILLLVAWLIYLIVAMIVRKSATVELGICDLHRARRRSFILITWLAVVLGFAGIFLGLMANEGTPALFGVFLLLAGIIFGLIAVRVTAPSRIDDQFVWLTGVNKDYLNQLPQWPALAR